MKPAAAAFWRETLLPELPLSAMRSHKDGLAAAMAYCTILGMPFPDWVRERLLERQVLTSLSASRPGQKHLRSKMELFLKNAVRYEAVRCSERPKKRSNKFDDAVEMLDGTLFKIDTSGLKKSYYAFEKIFATPSGKPSRRLSRYVAQRIIAADIANRRDEPLT